MTNKPNLDDYDRNHDNEEEEEGGETATKHYACETCNEPIVECECGGSLSVEFRSKKRGSYALYDVSCDNEECTVKCSFCGESFADGLVKESA